MTHSGRPSHGGHHSLRRPSRSILVIRPHHLDRCPPWVVPTSNEKIAPIKKHRLPQRAFLVASLALGSSVHTAVCKVRRCLPAPQGRAGKVLQGSRLEGVVADHSASLQSHGSSAALAINFELCSPFQQHAIQIEVCSCFLAASYELCGDISTRL
jgi:hypothetical protein